MKEIRKARLAALIAGHPYNGDRKSFYVRAGITKGRLAQLLDPEEPFGEQAANNLIEKLSLAPQYFDRIDANQAKNELHQTDPKPNVLGEPSATGLEIALLYDLIPVTDLVRRTRAYNAATAAILEVLEEVAPTFPGSPGGGKR